MPVAPGAQAAGVPSGLGSPVLPRLPAPLPPSPTRSQRPPHRGPHCTRAATATDIADSQYDASAQARLLAVNDRVAPRPCEPEPVLKGGRDSEVFERSSLTRRGKGSGLLTALQRKEEEGSCSVMYQGSPPALCLVLRGGGAS